MDLLSEGRFFKKEVHFGKLPNPWIYFQKVDFSKKKFILEIFRIHEFTFRGGARGRDGISKNSLISEICINAFFC